MMAGPLTPDCKIRDDRDEPQESEYEQVCARTNMSDYSEKKYSRRLNSETRDETPDEQKEHRKLNIFELIDKLMVLVEESEQGKAG
jgi:hypothetical protein